MVRVFIFAASALAMLSGCTATTSESTAFEGDLKSIAKTGYTAVVPTTSIRLGRLYFSGVGKRPAFVTADGVVYNELCYDDFRDTASLADINKYVVDEGITHSKKTITGNLVGSASLSTSKVKALGNLAIGADVNRNRTYVIDKIHTLSLKDAGVQVIKNNIGPGCKAEIAALRGKRNVILAMSVQRAEKATDTRTDGLGGNLGGSIGGTATSAAGKVTVTGQGAGIGFNRSHVVSDEFELVYLSVDMDSL